MMMRLITILFLLFWGSSLLGQPILILVKKGEVEVSNRLLIAGESAKLDPSSKIQVGPKALVLARNKGSIVELKAGASYNYTTISQLFNSKKSFSSAFTEVVVNQDYSNKIQTGATTRGLYAQDPWHYYPGDSLQIIGDSVVLEVGSSESRLETDILLWRANSTDTIRLTRSQSRHTFPRPPAGEYFWGYVISKGKTRNTFQNEFVVPEETRRKALLTAYQNFIQSIEGFSNEMQEQLILEYELRERVSVSELNR